MNDLNIGALFDEERKRKVPVIQPDGQVLLIEAGVFDDAIGTAERVERIVPIIPGMHVLFNHLDKISNNLFLFYTNEKVNTAYDLTVVVVSEKDQILKIGTVSALCMESFAFARFMETMYEDFSFAFAYPSITKRFGQKTPLPTLNYDCGDSWQPLLNGRKIGEDGEIIPDDQNKGVIKSTIPEEELPRDANGTVAEVARYDTPTFPNKSKIGIDPKAKD